MASAVVLKMEVTSRLSKAHVGVLGGSTRADPGAEAGGVMEHARLCIVSLVYSVPQGKGREDNVAL